MSANFSRFHVEDGGLVPDLWSKENFWKAAAIASLFDLLLRTGPL